MVIPSGFLAVPQGFATFLAMTSGQWRIDNVHDASA